MISLKRVTILFLFLFTIVLLTAQFASAQRLQIPQASQKATVMQRIGLTEVSITYSRPAVKGRTIWGDAPTDAKGEATLDGSGTKGMPLVPYGHVWRTGANESTLFVVNDDVLINGQPLAAGRYSLHSIPSKDGDWTIIFNKDDGQWGSFSYDATKDALRVKTKPQWVADSQELLTCYIDPVTADSATVNIRWEKALVPFTVQVKDVAAKAIVHLRETVAAAKADDWQTPMSAAGYALSNKSPEDAAKWINQSIKAIDMVIAAKPNFANMSRKASILFAAGRTQEAIASGERAVAIGKGDSTVKATDIAALEKRIADAKSAKP